MDYTVAENITPAARSAKSEDDLRNAEDFGIDLGRRPGGDHFLDVTEV